MSFNTSDSVSSQDLNMDVDPVSTMFELDHIDDEVRDRSLDVSIHRPRSPSMFSSKCDKEYHICVQRESEKMVEDDNDIKPTNSRGSIRLEYATQEGQNNQGSKVADTSLSQTSFSLYFHNQWTDFHKLSCAGKPQMRAIHTYVGYTKATTND